MKIVFHSIRAKNFLQIGNQMESFRLDKVPFTVIVGKNGSGKSTITDMLTYVLYKKPYRPIRKIAQLINGTNKKGMLVEIAFTIGKTQYVVRRGEKPKVFEIYRDKQLIEPDPSIGDMQDYLETQILKQNFKTFCQINVIGKATYKQFMSLGAPERRAVVEDILDSQIYSVMQTLAKSDLKDLQLDLTQVNNERLVIEQNIANTKALLAKYNEDRSSEIDGYRAKIASTEEEMKVLAETAASTKNALTENKERLETIISADKLDLVKSKLNQSIQDLGAARSKRDFANKNIQRIDLDKCPHCLQEVDDNHRAEILTKAKADVAEAEETIGKLEKVIEAIQDKLRQYESLRSEIVSQEHALQTYRQQYTMHKNAIESYEQQIERAQRPVPLPEGNSIEELTESLASVTDLYDELTAKSVKLKEAIKLLGDDGIKAKLISKYIPIINQHINRYLERMDMFVEFTLDEEFNETINAINREGFSFESFSEGQKMRIDLAILLTWRQIAMLRNSMTTNIFFLDEVADGSLDLEGMSEFLNLLREMEDSQNTFIISHKESTIDLFDTVIKVETDGNFSKYTHE